MELIEISKIFDIHYGNSFELMNLEQDESGVNFISRTSSNNGVSAKVKPIENTDPFVGNVLTVSLGGSVLETFIQTKPFYTGFHVFVLKPKREMSERELIYYCICIRENKYRYNYGRQANRTLRDLLIPAKVPDKFIKLKINELSNKPASNKKVSFDISKQKWFLVADLFEVSGTKTTPKRKLEEIGKGKYPYVTTQSTNNGIEGFYDFYTEEGNVLVIDSAVAGFCSYQGENFSASDHVEKLLPKFKLNKYIGLFLQTIINFEQFRYSYGKKFNQEKIRNTKIKLPVDSKDNPDWQFMEDYIKSLPYSFSI